MEEMRRFRDKHKMTREELAEEMGYSPRTLEGWEQNRSVPSARARKTFEEIKRKK